MNQEFQPVTPSRPRIVDLVAGIIACSAIALVLASICFLGLTVLIIRQEGFSNDALAFIFGSVLVLGLGLYNFVLAVGFHGLKKWAFNRVTWGGLVFPWLTKTLYSEEMLKAFGIKSDANLAEVTERQLPSPDQDKENE